MQATVLTPLPGTRLFHHLEQEDRLLYTEFPQDWAQYDMTEVVHRPAAWNRQSCGKQCASAAGGCTAAGFFSAKALRTFRETRSWSATVFAWQSNIDYRNVSRARP